MMVPVQEEGGPFIGSLSRVKSTTIKSLINRLTHLTRGMTRGTFRASTPNDADETSQLRIVPPCLNRSPPMSSGKSCRSD